jgi:hypothetical protein
MRWPVTGHAQDSQTDAQIVANGAEISLADCGGGDSASRDWSIVADKAASSGTAIEHIRATSSEEDALAICRSAALKNGDLSLRFKAMAGAPRQSGGLALRMATPKDYYLVEVDALRNRALFLLVRNGLAEEITLAVRAQDDRFTVYLNGDWIFTAYDKTFPHAGRTALWAEPGSITRFDRITRGPTPKPLSWQ